MYTKIKNLCDELSLEFDAISKERKELLTRLSIYIKQKVDAKKEVNLVYICTHNSRRSHFGQVWAQVAATYYSIPMINTFSGGKEATAFNPNAIEALGYDGFTVHSNELKINPTYHVIFGDKSFENTICYSKTYDDDSNPSSNFAAIMTCSDADENCPFIPGVDLRIGTTYDDPKMFDNTPQQQEKYLERSRQIARECLFTMSLIKNSPLQ